MDTYPKGRTSQSTLVAITGFVKGDDRIIAATWRKRAATQWANFRTPVLSQTTHDKVAREAEHSNPSLREACLRLRNLIANRAASSMASTLLELQLTDFYVLLTRPDRFLYMVHCSGVLLAAID